MEESATLRVVGDEGQDPFQQPLSPHATKPSPRMPLPINQGPGAFILLEGIPTISGRDKGEISIHSLPHIPSPLSGPTPSILSREDDYGQSYRRSQSRDHGEGGEEDTFFDDRSLEHRIQRSLDHAPRPMYLDTPASVPVTPNGPLSVGSGLRKNKMALNSTQSKRRAAHASKMQNLVDDKQLSPRGSMVVLKLKQDVRNKDGELYLLRQGMNETKEQILQIQNCNDRLEERCEKAEARSGKLEKQSEAAGRALEEMKYELQARKDENQQIVAERNTMESEAKQLREQMDSLQSENREMSARIRSLLQEHRDDMKTFNETAESRIDRLKIELTSAHEEVDTLKNSLERVNNKNAELEKELEQGTGCRQAELSALSKQLEASRDEKINLEEAMQAADKESRRAVQDLETKEKEFKLGRESDHLEISRLRSTLNEAKKLNENSPAEIMIAEPGPSTEEPNELQKEKIEEFEKVNHQLAKDLAHLKLALDQSNAEKKTQLGEIRRLESALEEARKISSRQNLDVTFANGPSGAVVTPGCLKAHDESIADRLVRIRDAAERAALVKEHQREIARLKAQHQKACQALVTQHEQRLEDAVNEAKSTLNDKNDIAVESLKSDLEIRLATIEKRHREEVKRLEDEAKDGARVADESLAIAMAKLNSSKHRLDREVAKRDHLQHALNQVQKQLVSEKQQRKDEHEVELRMLKQGWDDEKGALLEDLQRECNQVFEEHGQPPGRRIGSPRSVDWGVSEFMGVSRSPKAFKESLSAGASPATNNDPTRQLENCSPFSKIDEELRETEALVRGLLQS